MNAKEAVEYVTEHYVSCRVMYMDEREVAYGKLLQAAAVLRDRVVELETQPCQQGKPLSDTAIAVEETLSGRKKFNAFITSGNIITGIHPQIQVVPKE